MIRRVVVASLFALAVTTVGLVRAQQPDAAAAAVMFEAAQQKETVEGDLRGAITLYEAIVSTYGKTSRPIAAKALLRSADLHQRLRDGQALEVYARVAREFPEQTEAVNQARARLAALGPQPRAGVSDSVVLRREGFMPFSTLSSNGTSITFVDDLALASLSLPAGALTQVVPNPAVSGTRFRYPVLSPDGKQVVFLATVGGSQYELRLTATTPGASTRVLRTTDSENRHFVPWAWSPDGRSFLMEVERGDRTWQVASYSVGDNSFHVLKSLEWRRSEFMGRMALSPDGRYVAYKALAVNPSRPQPTPADPKDTHIFVLALDGSNPNEVDLTPVRGTNQDPVWSEDGSHVLYLSDRGGSMDLWATAMLRGKPVGQSAVVRRNIGQVRPLGMTAGAYYYTAEPRAVTYISFAATGKPGASANAPAQGDPLGNSPAFSPDGRSIAFLRTVPGGGTTQELVIRSLASGDEKVFWRPDGATFASGPLWLHGGRTVLQAVTHLGAAGSGGTLRSFFRANGDTGELSEVKTLSRFNVGGAFSAALAADDRTLYVRGPVWHKDPPPGPNNRVVAMDLVDGTHRDITTPPGLIVTGLAVSPNNRTLALTTVELEANGTLAIGAQRARLARVDIDGGNYRDLFGPFVLGAVDPVWSPDGRSIFIAPPLAPASGRSSARTIVQVNADTGVVTGTGLEFAGLQSFGLSPDGSSVVVGRGNVSVTEVHALENLSAVLPKLP